MAPTLSRRLGAALAFTSTLALAPAAFADDMLSATRGEIVERSHTVDLRVSRGHAHLRVVREVSNLGERHDQAIFHLMLPPGAVATGLRTRGTIGGRPVWYEGELLEAELAARRYHELTGLGGYYPKDPALLSWRSQGHLALQVFPCPPKEDKAVGYDLDLPTRWVEGRERLELGAIGLPEGRARATLHTDIPHARIFVGDREVAAGSQIVLDGSSVIEVEPPRPVGTIDGRLAAVPFGPDRNLVALRFDAPKAIAEVPRNARVVVAIDASRSRTEDEVAAEMRAASAYLSHFRDRDARVALLAFDRRVRDLTKGFVGVEEARAVLDGAAPPRGNGSAVDDAISRASVLLASAPTGSARRVLVLGDLLTKSAIVPARVATPKGATLHLATVREGDLMDVERDDESPWAVVPRATGGVLFHAWAPGDPQLGADDRAKMAQTFLEWARPVRVDRMSWRAAGVEPEPELGVLEEGDAIEHRAISEALPANAILEGELWSRPFRKKIVAEANEGRVWSALVFGSDLLGALDEGEMNVLARAGRAVSPVTSYLAIEPGVRPSTEGLEASEIGGMGFGSGAGRLGGSRVRHAPPAPNYGALLSSLLSEAVKTCGGAGRTTVDAETTLAEVVEVSVVVRGEGDDHAASRCIDEATWALELPEVFREPHLDLHVSL